MTKQALLVIDVQCIYTQPNGALKVEGSKEMIENINQVIRHFAKHKLPIVYVRHVHKADGSDSGRMWDFSGTQEEIGFLEGTRDVEYDPDLVRVPKSIEIVKNRYSAFAGTNLQDKLRDLEITRIVITGFMTNFCCEATARSAHDLDYFVDFVMDATGCPDLEDIAQPEIKTATSATLQTGYAVVMTTKEFLALDLNR